MVDGPNGTTTEPPWLMQLGEQFGQLHLAHDAAGLDNLQRKQRVVERLVRKTQDGTLGQVDPTSDESPEEDMGVSVGNRTVHNYYGQPAAEAATVGGSLIKRVGLAAALLAAGGGVGAAVPWLLERLQVQPAAVAPQAADKDTLFDLRFGTPPQATE